MIRNKIRYFSRFLHKWIGILIFIQILAWALGGFIFAITPKGLLKGTDYINSSNLSYENIYPLEQILKSMPNQIIIDVKIINLLNMPFYKITTLKENYFFNAKNGKKISQPSEEEVKSYARTLYKGSADISSVKIINSKELKWFIVDELYGKYNMYQIKFDDFVNTRFYFDKNTGEFYKTRNDIWVLYDFFWRFHIMDYTEGENYNNWLLKILAFLTNILTISGIFLIYYFFKNKYHKYKISQL